MSSYFDTEGFSVITTSSTGGPCAVGGGSALGCTSSYFSNHVGGPAGGAIGNTLHGSTSSIVSFKPLSQKEIDVGNLNTLLNAIHQTSAKLQLLVKQYNDLLEIVKDKYEPVE